MTIATVFRPGVVACLALLLTLPGLAQKKPARAKSVGVDPNSVVFYRCVDREGNVSLQNDVPCAKGQKQTRQVLQKPSIPVFTPAPAAPASVSIAPAPSPILRAAEISPASTPVVRSALPPPPLYRCYTLQQKSYLSDNGAPKSRCVALTPSNADPNDPNTPKMCDMQQDTCERIPDQDACAAWTQYDREAKALVEMGHPDFINDAIALSARTQKVLTQSTCAAAAQNP